MVDAMRLPALGCCRPHAASVASNLPGPGLEDIMLEDANDEPRLALLAHHRTAAPLQGANRVDICRQPQLPRPVWRSGCVANGASPPIPW